MQGINGLGSMHAEFRHLEGLVGQLLSLLSEAEDSFWPAYFRRGLVRIEKRELAGATFVLGCYNGTDTFSDLVIGQQWQTSDPVRYRNLNARLSDLRTRVFKSANQIASRNLW